jgi:hypothetical protein
MLTSGIFAYCNEALPELDKLDAKYKRVLSELLAREAEQRWSAQKVLNYFWWLSIEANPNHRKHIASPTVFPTTKRAEGATHLLFTARRQHPHTHRPLRPLKPLQNNSRATSCSLHHHTPLDQPSTNHAQQRRCNTHPMVRPPRITPTTINVAPPTGHLQPAQRSRMAYSTQISTHLPGTPSSCMVSTCLDHATHYQYATYMPKSRHPQSTGPHHWPPLPRPADGNGSCRATKTKLGHLVAKVCTSAIERTHPVRCCIQSDSAVSKLEGVF